MSTEATGLLHRRMAVVVFLAFAAAYFFSALVRAITATLSPTLSAEFQLGAGDLGLLAGGYFLGFSAMQLPLGNLLDRYGPKRVIQSFLLVAVLGCMAFAWATSFNGLLAARVLTGMGVSACLMAPLTGYRRWLRPEIQLRANSWMLMTGSFGMVAATLPVQWLMPLVGWRGLFWLLAAAVVVSMLTIAVTVPGWSPGAVPDKGGRPDDGKAGAGYAEVWRHPYFRKMTLIGFFNYGGMVAVQTLWAGPWMVKVAGYSASEAARGLFWINLSMLCIFWLWGLVMPRLSHHGVRVEKIIAWGLPLSLLVLGANIAAGVQTGWLGWALFCVSSTFVSLSQPAVALAFPPAMAGRALSAFNLVIFSGVFVVQWGIGLVIDGLRRADWSEIAAFQGAMGVYLLACFASYAYFLSVKADNQRA